MQCGIRGGTIRVCVMASTLGYLRDPRALSVLTEAMFDPGNRDLRLCAIQSLGMIGDTAAVPALIEALQGNNTPVAAANAIARIGDAALPSLGVQLQQGSAGEQLYVAAILGYAGKREDVDRLQQLVNSQGQGRLASVAQRSIELIYSYIKPDDGFTDFAQLEVPDR